MKFSVFFIYWPLDEALKAFSEVAPRQAKVVELRYFGGLTEEEILGGFENLAAHRQARLGLRQGLAAAGTKPLELKEPSEPEHDA